MISNWRRNDTNGAVSARPVIGLVAAVLLSCFLAACGGGGGGSDPEPPPPAINPPPPPPPPSSGLPERPPNATCSAPTDTAGEVTSLSLERAFPDLPGIGGLLHILQLPGSDEYWYAIQRSGVVLRFANDAASDSLEAVLDYSATVESGPGEAGLLGIAFHPQVASNREVYLSYTRGGPLRSVLSRFQLSVDGSSIDPNSEEILLTINQPFGNHNGGHIAFGPDGFLYWGMGDGGSGGDPQNNGQNPANLLGTVMRIDVDNGNPYAIPADNPFANGGGAPEIYAYGLRNPWRWSFDRQNGELWLGDVGQNEFEEIDRIELGGNYGWNTMEASSCFGGGNCDQTGLELPITEYDHSVGCSVTGGYVYRGTALAALQGTYLFGDFCSGNIWGVDASGGIGQTPTLLGDSFFNISSFAQANDGELYVLNIGGGTGNGIHRIAGIGTTQTTAVPERLSDTGCVSAQSPAAPANGVIDYSVIQPFWSDNADKERYFAIPDGAQIAFANDGTFDLPVGSVVLKNFQLNDRYIETRILYHEAAGWKGYSYEWLDDQSDALLLQAGKEEVIDGQTWVYPSSTQCDSCHTSTANFLLGLGTRQLNSPHTYQATGIEFDQLETLDFIGLFSQTVTDGLISNTIAALDDASASLEFRARSYLDVNCAQCHQPGGTGASGMDLRITTELPDMNICDVAPADNLGINDARLIAAGDPTRSIILERISRLDDNRMPPLASTVVDDAGVALLTQWINSLASCP